MIFKEVVEQILFERNIDYKELADELGISFLQVENLHSGKTKRPNERIYNKLIEYCKKHSIEIDINWNDVLYDIFTSCDWDKEYVWLRDLDEEDCVLLRHRVCGKKTKVPSNAFGGNSIPCIHCWVDKYVSTEAYNFNLSEDDYRHEFRHRCGNSYFVTYDEIKQKKFRCPTCAGYKYNAYNINKNRKALENTPTIWEYKIKEQVYSIALENNFSVEAHDSLLCKLNYPTMKDNQFVLVCNRCFHAEVFDKEESCIDKVKEYIVTHMQECEKADECILERTKNKKLVWIPDTERVLYMTSLNSLNNDYITDFIEKTKNEEYSHEVYVAGNHDGEEHTAYLFWHYYNDSDDKDSFNFLISLKPNRFYETSLYTLPNQYIDSLYRQIIASQEENIINLNNLQCSCDEYIDIVNFFKKNNQLIYVSAAFPKIADKMSVCLKQKELSVRQKDTERILSLQQCPVCHSFYNSKETFCNDCGFGEINKVFINKDEYELWLNNVVLPARKRREETN